MDFAGVKLTLIQAIAQANVDPDLCHHMASLDHNELNRHWTNNAIIEK